MKDANGGRVRTFLHRYGGADPKALRRRFRVVDDWQGGAEGPRTLTSRETIAVRGVGRFEGRDPRDMHDGWRNPASVVAVVAWLSAVGAVAGIGWLRGRGPLAGVRVWRRTGDDEKR
ncbi:MAG: hypothetical protein WD011_06875 [Nitriliruptoraceae bacterium]